MIFSLDGLIRHHQTMLALILVLLLPACSDGVLPADTPQSIPDDDDSPGDDDDSAGDDDDSAGDDDDSAGDDDDSAAPLVDEDGDGSPLGLDCDDGDPSVHPLAVESCDEVDSDCDQSLADEFDDQDADDIPDCVDLDDDGDNYPDAIDCAPLDAAIYPLAIESCDGQDNDCDGLVDESDAVDAALWYGDADGDGSAGSILTVLACNQPAGFASSADDCNDLSAVTYPGAAELCDGADNDCNNQIDDNPVNPITVYNDTDGDGYGDSSAPLSQCFVTAGTTLNGGDCDDTEPLAHPGGIEHCDSFDNDCDGVIDEPDAVDAGTWYADLDQDGAAGALVTQRSCSQPAGYLSSVTDCNDLNAAALPGGTEICDGIDNDCNNQIDDNPTDLLTFAPDTDGDGFGDSSASQQGCSVPVGSVPDATDCNDQSAAALPGGTEICDGIDNDCNNQIDDNPTDQSTWYEDADGDGRGDPLSSILSCSQPGGYVADNTDCDPSSNSDIDGDTLLDCEDGDIDGDTLRNEWDAAPADASVVHGPLEGLGGGGSVTVSSSEIWSLHTSLVGGASSSDASLTVGDPTLFQPGDEVLILSLQGNDAGSFETAFVTGADAAAGTVDIEPALASSFESASTVVVQRIPHFSNLIIETAGSVTVPAWDGSGGGVLVVRATNDVIINGSLNMTGKGYRGGDGVHGNAYSPQQGESYLGLGSLGVAAPNQGGGGAYPRRGDNADGGGGGGYGSPGDASDPSANTSTTTPGGDSYGVANLSALFVGSGGGGGSPDTEGDGSHQDNYSGDGGAGGGSVEIFAGASITITGSVLADGQNGDDAFSPSHNSGENGGGGAGSGGSIYLASPGLDCSGTVSALGGSGGNSASYNASSYHNIYGGSGGDGRIRLDGTLTTGSTTPSAGHTGAFGDSQ